LGLVFAFLSGLAWAGLDVARKSLASRHSGVVVAGGLSLGAGFLFALALPVAGARMDVSAYLGPGLLSTALGISTQLLILESLRRSSLSRTIPMLSFTPVATAVFGAVVLNERPAWPAWVGIVLVVLGALALGLQRDGTDGAGNKGGSRFDIGVALMLLAAVSVSAAAPFDKLAVEASTALVHGLVQSFGAAAVLLGFLAVRGELGEISAVFRRRPAMTAAVVAAAVAIALQYVAYQGAMVGEVETIKRVVGSVASLATGFVVFSERITPTKVVAVIALGAGVALILLNAA